MNKTIRFLHLTDLHIANPDATEPHLYTDTSETLAKVLATARMIDPSPSFVIVSGDIANNADPAAYAELKRVWGDYDVPTLHALGNHDSREAFYEIMHGRTENAGAPYFHDQVIDGVHVIVLDSSTPRQIHGTIEPEQFAWLEQVLGQHQDLPKVVVTHHPPAFSDEHGRHPFEAIAYDDSHKLGEMLRGRNVVAILAGHVHHDSVTLWNGIPVIISNGHHSTSDVLHRGGLRSVEGAGFSMITLRPNGTMTVNFLPLITDRRELSRTSLEQLEHYVATLQAAE